MDKHILIVDDDTDLSYIISEMLTGYGYAVTCSVNSEEAISLLSDHSYHLIVLDINLPDAEGFEICRELRSVSNVPVIFASARTSEDDRIAGFNIGGDDYLMKPYSMKELLARINALMRRAYGSEQSDAVISFGDVKVDTASRMVTKGGCKISLALKEFDLLEQLAKNKNKAVAKNKLISEVWGAFSDVEPSTLTVHIRWLREKLENNPAQPEFIKTVWGIGYMLEVHDEA